MSDCVFGPRVRPDDSLAQGFAGLATPRDGGFALVCDSCERSWESLSCDNRKEKRYGRTDDLDAVFRPAF